MATHKTPMVIGNWKMNPRTAAEAVGLAKAVGKIVKTATTVTVGITPPSLFLPDVAKVVSKVPALRLGLQHSHPGPIGAFTGEVSPAMVVPYGVTYALVGHSERRALGENDAFCNQQLLALLKHKMIPILCVGERARDTDANFFGEVEAQLTAAVAGVAASRYKDVVIAYEPIWAIGTGKTATVVDVEEMQLFIRKVLTKLAGRTAAAAPHILYGGSVQGDTAAALYAGGGIDGFLVGGASLRPADFAMIIQGVATV